MLSVMRAFGTPPSRPTLIGTDNLANFKIATALKHYEACLRACNVVLTRNALLPHVPNTTIEFRYTRYYMANQRALQALA